MKWRAALPLIVGLVAPAAAQWPPDGGSPPSVQIWEATSYKGAPIRHEFSDVFDITCTAGGCVIALNSTVSLFGGEVEKSEAEASFVHDNDANTFTAQQTIKPRLTVQTTGGATLFDCGTGVFDVECLVANAPATGTAIANKSYVDAHYAIPFSLLTGSATVATLATRQYYAGPSVGSADSIAPQPMPVGCTVKKLYVRQKGSTFEANTPTGNTIRVGIRKQSSDTGAVTCDMAAGTGTCNTTAGALAFTAGQYFSFFAECINAGSACTDAATRAFAIVILCEGP